MYVPEGRIVLTVDKNSFYDASSFHLNYENYLYIFYKFQDMGGEKESFNSNVLSF